MALLLRVLYSVSHGPPALGTCNRQTGRLTPHLHEALVEAAARAVARRARARRDDAVAEERAVWVEQLAHRVRVRPAHARSGPGLVICMTAGRLIMLRTTRLRRCALLQAGGAAVSRLQAR
jgi:hypothetical protein